MARPTMTCTSFFSGPSGSAASSSILTRVDAPIMCATSRSRTESSNPSDPNGRATDPNPLSTISSTAGDIRNRVFAFWRRMYCLTPRSELYSMPTALSVSRPYVLNNLNFRGPSGIFWQGPPMANASASCRCPKRSPPLRNLMAFRSWKRFSAIDINAGARRRQSITACGVTHRESSDVSPGNAPMHSFTNRAANRRLHISRHSLRTSGSVGTSGGIIGSALAHNSSRLSFNGISRRSARAPQRRDLIGRPKPSWSESRRSASRNSRSNSV
mmetsp:Transcript_32746/g.37946  ORF Transcript_32746/g.37946 Transcript_32746/m.37946 type:complete len:271 (-) Transcript_32746:522-1334(-)